MRRSSGTPAAAAIRPPDDSGTLDLRDCAEPDPAHPGLTLCGFKYAGDCADWTRPKNAYACKSYEPIDVDDGDCHGLADRVLDDLHEGLNNQNDARRLLRELPRRPRQQDLAQRHAFPRGHHRLPEAVVLPLRG